MKTHYNMKGLAATVTKMLLLLTNPSELVYKMIDTLFFYRKLFRFTRVLSAVTFYAVNIVKSKNRIISIPQTNKMRICSPEIEYSYYFQVFQHANIPVPYIPLLSPRFSFAWIWKTILNRNKFLLSTE